MDGAGEALSRLGCLPGEVRPEWLARLCEAGDLLPELAAIWRCSASAARGAAGIRQQRIAERLEQWQTCGGQLTWGVPGPAGQRLDQWLDRRLAWWPGGLPAGRWVGLVSSRLGRDLARCRNWFAALRSACMHLEPRCDLLVTARSTTTQRFVHRAGQLFGVRVLDVTIAGEGGEPTGRWAERLLGADPAQFRGDLQLFLSPAADAQSGEAADAPAADRAVIGLVERLIVLAARPQGNVQRLVDRRLADSAFPAASTYLALGTGLVPPRLGQTWMGRGAVGWYLQGGEAEATGEVERPPWWAAEPPRNPPAPVRRLPGKPGRPLLTHWTRRCSGPWPDEQESDYLDDLILDRRGADHSPFAALWRIVQTRRLIATASLIRGGTPMVCFTEVSPGELPQLRAFRPHLSRWDFELYGIAIDRQWLQACGSRPVHYGDQQAREQMPEADRPYFQQRYSQTAAGERWDWSREREWRHAGDVLLAQLPATAAILFVPEFRLARQIAGISPWPVAVLDTTQ